MESSDDEVDTDLHEDGYCIYSEEPIFVAFSKRRQGDAIEKT